MDEKEKMILDALKKAKKPMRPGEIAEATGLSKDEVSKIIKNLNKQGLVDSPKRCFWAPT